jgi:DNA-binding cell septation regulator SpoVG
MTITDIRLHFPKTQDTKLLAYATVVIDDCLAIHDLKVIQGDRSPFVQMPSKLAFRFCDHCKQRHDYTANWCPACGYEALEQPDPEKTHYDVVHPINRQTRVQFESDIIGAYTKEIAKRSLPAAQTTAA